MAVRKIKGSWWVDFRHGGVRHRHRSPINTKSDAKEHEIYLRTAISSRETSSDSPGGGDTSLTFSAFAERWLREYVDVNNGRSERYNKRKSLRSKLVPFFGEIRIDRITVNLVEQFKARLLQDALNPKTINNHLTILNRCLGSARDWELVAAAPRIRLLRTAKPAFRFLTPGEADVLLDSIDEEPLHAMVRTALRAGLRYSELRALHWEDVDFERQQITVRRAYILRQIGPTKNFRIRHIPMTPDLTAALQRLPRTSALVFSACEKHSRQLEQLKLACKLACVPVVGWHGLRHSFASHLMTAGAPIHAVQTLLGHSSVEMTMRYSHLAPSVLHATVNLLTKPIPLWASDGHQVGINGSERALAVSPQPPLQAQIFTWNTQKTSPVGDVLPW